MAWQFSPAFIQAQKQIHPFALLWAEGLVEGGGYEKVTLQDFLNLHFVKLNSLQKI